MIRRPPRSTLSSSSAASDVYKRQDDDRAEAAEVIGTPLYTDWLFGGKGRIAELQQALLTPVEGTFNIVLTNGFSKDVAVALGAIGLTDAFRAIVDTRGCGLVAPYEGSRGCQGKRVDTEEEFLGVSQYSKFEFANKYLFNADRAARNGLSNKGVGHLIYVDDSVEPEFSGDDLVGTADVVELPREGRGLDTETLAEVFDLRAAAVAAGGEKEVCVIFDFDCTLSSWHMFKSLYQPKSKWGKEWQGVQEAGESTAAISRAGRADLQEKIRPDPASAEADIHDGRNFVRVVPYGVLGTQLLKTRKMVQKAGPPGPTTAFVDPAGLHHIQPPGGPGSAGGAAGAIYDFLGIAEDERFPQDVIDSVTKPGDAKIHVYSFPNSSQFAACIHVVGPDFRQDDLVEATFEAAVSLLSCVYANVLKEFGSVGGIGILRVLPVSGGIFAGKFQEDIARLTAFAFDFGLQKLAPEELACLEGRQVEMCIFEEAQFDEFVEQFELRKRV
eukprot:TRINITY_DN61759_c0_g1_i1.p1 TRINITY_DN61759_c0_g1~~TRINITY_DN61759_c0_g1_i1.p1  ORF type:complete len:499 (+),score=109.17 TRINITY_DN61759_c0_g1_i1:99-1595(+)